MESSDGEISDDEDPRIPREGGGRKKRKRVMAVDVGVELPMGVVSGKEENVVDVEVTMKERLFGFGSEVKRRTRTRRVSTRSSPFLFLRRWPLDDLERRCVAKRGRMKSGSGMRRRTATRVEGEMSNEQRRKRRTLDS